MVKIRVPKDAGKRRIIQIHQIYKLIFKGNIMIWEKDVITQLLIVCYL